MHVGNGKRRDPVIESEDGNTVFLMTEEWVELARNLTREDFQVLVLDNMRRLDERLRLVEEATSKAVTDLKQAITELKRLNGNDVTAHRKLTEAAEEIRRLKTWTGCPEKHDPPTKGGAN
jgi:hypothetical protein